MGGAWLARIQDGASGRIRRLGIAAVSVALLLAGCGTTHVSSVLNAPAPLTPDVNLCCFKDGSYTTQPPGLTAIRGRDGSKAWHVDTGNTRVLAQFNGVVYGAGTLGAGSRVTLVAVRLGDGGILWQARLPFAGGQTPGHAKLATDGTTLLLTDSKTGLYALDAATGRLRWHVAEAVTGQFLVGDGVAVALAVGRADTLAHLAVYDEKDGALLWRGPDFRKDVLSIGANRRAVYLSATEATDAEGPNALLAYDLRSGNQLWRNDVVGGIIAVSDETVTLGSDSSSTVACFDATTGARRWKVQAPFVEWHDVSHSPSALYLPDSRTSAHLLALSMTDGARLWAVNLGRYLVQKAVQQQGVVFVFLIGPQDTLSGKIPDRIVALDAATGTVYWERDVGYVVSTA